MNIGCSGNASFNPIFTWSRSQSQNSCHFNRLLPIAVTYCDLASWPSTSPCLRQLPPIRLTTGTSNAVALKANPSVSSLVYNVNNAKYAVTALFPAPIARSRTPDVFPPHRRARVVSASLSVSCWTVCVGMRHCCAITRSSLIRCTSKMNMKETVMEMMMGTWTRTHPRCLRRSSPRHLRGHLSTPRP